MAIWIIIKRAASKEKGERDQERRDIRARLGKNNCKGVGQKVIEVICEEEKTEKWVHILRNELGSQCLFFNVLKNILRMVSRY